MLETRLKIAFLVAILFLTSLPVVGILKGTRTTPLEDTNEFTNSHGASSADQVPRHAQEEVPLPEEMVFIPEGPFLRGTGKGGFDEGPEGSISLKAFSIDKYETTNYHYQEFITAKKHRKAGPPSRYAKNLARIRGTNQPIVYVSWEDAQEYCKWRGKRLPTEAEWEKAMRGTDGRLWPWGNTDRPSGANLGRVNDGHEVTARVGSFPSDVSPYGVADGVGNVMEWVADWYEEKAYQNGVVQDPVGPEHGVFKVLRGGGYTSTGSDVRITSRSKMVPNFRDETIGFRCAVSGKPLLAGEKGQKTARVKENQNSRGLKRPPK